MIDWSLWSNLPNRIQQTRGNEFDFSSISPAAVEAYSNYQAMKPKRRLELLNRYNEANKNIKDEDLKNEWLTGKQKEAYDADLAYRRNANLKNIMSEPEPVGATTLAPLVQPEPSKQSDKVKDFEKDFGKAVTEINTLGGSGYSPESKGLGVLTDPYNEKYNGPDFGLDNFRNGLTFDEKAYESTPDLSDKWDELTDEQKAKYFTGEPTKEELDNLRSYKLQEALGKEYEDALSAFDEYGNLNEYQRMRKAGEQASIWNPEIGKILLDASDRVKEDRIQGWKEAVELTSQRYKQAMELYEKTGIWSYKRDAENYMNRLGELMENNPRRADAKDWWYEGEPEETKTTPETDALKALEEKIGSGEIADMTDFQNDANMELWNKLSAEDKRGLENYLSKLIASRTAARDKEYTDLTSYIQTNVDPGFVNDQAETSLRISTLSSIDNILNKDPKKVTSGDYQTAIAALQKMGNNVRNQFDSKKQIRWNNINSNISNAWKNDDYGKLFGSLMEGAGFLLGEAFGLNEKDMNEIGKNPQRKRIVQETIRSELQKAQAEFNNRARYVNESLTAAQRRVPAGYINLTEKALSENLPPITVEQLATFNKDVPAEVVTSGAEALLKGENEFKVGKKDYVIDQYIIKEKEAPKAAPAAGGKKNPPKKPARVAKGDGGDE